MTNIFIFEKTKHVDVPFQLEIEGRGEEVHPPTPMVYFNFNLCVQQYDQGRKYAIEVGKLLDRLQDYGLKIEFANERAETKYDFTTATTDQIKSTLANSSTVCRISYNDKSQRFDLFKSDKLEFFLEKACKDLDVAFPQEMSTAIAAYKESMEAQKQALLADRAGTGNTQSTDFSRSTTANSRNLTDGTQASSDSVKPPRRKSFLQNIFGALARGSKNEVDSEHQKPTHKKKL